jgi:hypothetical protein
MTMEGLLALLALVVPCVTVADEQCAKEEEAEEEEEEEGFA